MVAPINYLAGLPQPDIVGSLTQGLQAGAAINQIRAQQQAAEQARVLKEQYGADLKDVFSNPTPQAFSQLIAKYPQQREAFKQSWDILSEDQKNNEFLSGAQAYNAIASGNIDVAKNLLDQRIEAAKNSGKDTKNLVAMRDAIDANPKSVQANIGLILSSADPKRWSEMTKEMREAELHPGALEKQAADLGMTRAEVNKLMVDTRKSIADISKTNVDAEKVAYEAALKSLELRDKSAGVVELSEDAKKLINQSVTTATNLKSLSNQYRVLADSITTDMASGAAGKASEKVKGIFGSEDNVTRLRQEYRRLRNSQVLNNLPPGVASDRDIQIAMEAFPSDTADPALIASFLKGVAKLQDYDASINEAKAEWVNSVGTLGKSRAPLTIMGKSFPVGTNFNDAISSIISPESAIGQKATSASYKPANASRATTQQAPTTARTVTVDY